MRRKLEILLLVIFLLSAGFAGWKLMGIGMAYETEAAFYRDLRSRYVSDDMQELYLQPARPEEAGESASLRTFTGQPPLSVDFDALQAVNPDIIGWIHCEDTVISYPVLHCDDNETYLYRQADGSRTGGGAIFLDCAAMPDFSGDNSVLYGHNMKSGSMFGTLSRYGSQSWLDDHSEIWLLTPECSYRVRPYAALVVDSGGWAYTVSFPDRAEKQSFLDRADSSAVARGDITPNPDDRILTLSTCTYNFAGARFVLMGILELCVNG